MAVKEMNNTSWFVIQRKKPFTGEYLAVGTIPVFGCLESAKRYTSWKRASAALNKLGCKETLEIVEIPLNTRHYGKNKHDQNMIIVGTHPGQKTDKKYYFWMSDYLCGLRNPKPLKDFVGVVDLYVKVEPLSGGRRKIVKIEDIISASESPVEPTAIAKTLYVPMDKPSKE